MALLEGGRLGGGGWWEDIGQWGHTFEGRVLSLASSSLVLCFLADKREKPPLPHTPSAMMFCVTTGA
jgi:hypothetical protein